VHGLSETGTIFDRFAEQLFSTRGGRERVARIISIDLVGHGESSLPEQLPSGVRFGELTIEDNVDVVLQVIDLLRKKRLAPQIIMGHSMGGLTVQAAQETLLARGSSLAALGVRRAVLLAPVPPTARPWVRGPSADVSMLIKTTPELGSYFDLPDELFAPSNFTTLSGTLAPNAPTTAQVAERGYAGIEPLLTLLQLVEDPSVPLKRPAVRAGAFAKANGTKLTLVSFSQDTLVPADNLPDLYRYLTDDGPARGMRSIVADDAVHAVFISNPALVVDALRDVF
jgi:pimeloyl-ACP methyl ester carboxylesterase